MTARVRMYELDNEQPGGIDIPDNCTPYKNQFILESFLHRVYPVHLDWGNERMRFIVLIESDTNIVGMCALIPYKKRSAKVHIGVMAIEEKWQRKGLGTEMLKHTAVMYPQQEVTLSVPFDQCGVLNFYLNKGYAKMQSIDTDKKCFILSLVNLKLLQDVSLPE